MGERQRQRGVWEGFYSEGTRITQKIRVRVWPGVEAKQSFRNEVQVGDIWCSENVNNGTGAECYCERASLYDRQQIVELIVDK